MDGIEYSSKCRVYTFPCMANDGLDPYFEAWPDGMVFHDNGSLFFYTIKHNKVTVSGSFYVVVEPIAEGE